MPATQNTAPPKAVWLMAAMLLAVAACNAPEPCGSPGLVLVCSCGGSAKGARVCSAKKVWGACDCSGAILLPRSNPPGAADAGTRTNSSSTGGSSGSSMKPSGAGGTPMISMSDEDAGPGRVGQGGSGGRGGMGGAGGKGGADAGPTQPTPGAYGACMATTDCIAGAQCIMTPSFPNNATVCAPACVDVGGCPKPEGSYEATLACESGVCRLDCTPVLFAPLLSCPTGMTCVAPLFGTAYCNAGP